MRSPPTERLDLAVRMRASARRPSALLGGRVALLPRGLEFLARPARCLGLGVGRTGCASAFERSNSSLASASWVRSSSAAPFEASRSDASSSARSDRVRLSASSASSSSARSLAAANPARAAASSSFRFSTCRTLACPSTRAASCSARRASSSSRAVSSSVDVVRTRGVGRPQLLGQVRAGLEVLDALGPGDDLSLRAGGAVPRSPGAW